MNTLQLDSIRLSELIRWVTYDKYKVWLNKTQLQKFMYISYGVYLAITENRIFDDDTPKAWPFGPVFPRINKKINLDIEPSEPAFNSDYDALPETDPLKKVVEFVTFTYKDYSAKALSDWSHRDDGPWFQTVYPNGNTAEEKWNQVIDDEKIKTYFQKNFIKNKA